MPEPAVEPEQPSGPVENRDDFSALAITGPSGGSAVRGEVEITGTASGKAFASYQVEYGEGSDPSSWNPVGGKHSGAVDNGVLERWDTRSLNGLYKIRITLTERPLQPSGPQPTATPAPDSTPTPCAARHEGSRDYSRRRQRAA